MIELAEFSGGGAPLGRALPRLGRERRHAAIRRIDDDRAARQTIDPHDAIAGIEPEIVVAADLAAGGR